ncbi:MAG: thioredoxin family protein [Alistipes sp.]|nr:thioredoxin family protein [Alistipes sp.]
MTLENFKQIISQDRLTLVDFYATWCGLAEPPTLFLINWSRSLSMMSM